MSVHRLPAGTVLLTPEDVAAVLYALDTAQKARARNGYAPSRALARLRLELAAPGHPDSPAEPIGEPETVTTREAAALLQVSERTARRLAPRLGGRNVGGRLLFDRRAVLDHDEGRNLPGTEPSWPLLTT